ncbi:hypothetical protein pb186bvf_001973 [Paramecium bursaria]
MEYTFLLMIWVRYVVTCVSFIKKLIAILQNQYQSLVIILRVIDLLKVPSQNIS